MKYFQHNNLMRCGIPFRTLLLQWLLPIWYYKHGSLECSKVLQLLHVYLSRI